MSFHAALTNRTPFAAEKVVLVDPEGQEAVLVVLAATFDAAPNGTLLPAAEPPAVLLEDLYAGSPGVSCLLVEGELALTKPYVDVLVRGSAYAPGGRAVERVRVELHAGTMTKMLVVSGDRTWALGTPTRPVPFTTMPIRYDRAFGGLSPQTGREHADNPIGVGLDGAESQDPSRRALPNVEYPDSMMTALTDRPRVAGFGPIVRWWPSRARFAGTYDETWKNERWPVLPHDFDARFNQAAPLDQQSSTLAGGEIVTLVNLTPDGLWRLRLPRLRVPVCLVYDSGATTAAFRVDTILLEPDKRQVRLTARFALTTVRGNTLREIVLGPMTRGWHLSVAKRKPYLDFRGTGGMDPTVPVYD